jgi:hypothetical protein
MHRFAILDESAQRSDYVGLLETLQADSSAC